MPTGRMAFPLNMQTAGRFRARALVLRYGWNSTAFQIVNPGMTRWFSADGEAVVGYVTSGGFRVVAGEPVCHPSRLGEIVAAFEHDARCVGDRVCYFCVQERLAKMVAATRDPLSQILIGAQPAWNPQHWQGILRRKSSLRGQLSRARNKHVYVSRWSSEQAMSHPSLLRCLDEWLQNRGLPPMHFLIEPETLACLTYRRVYVAEQHERVVGFLVASPVPLRQGWLIEQIVRGHQAPNGTAELLIDAAMRDAAASGDRYVTFGLSPLSSRGGIPLPLRPVWLRLLLGWVREHGRRFYNFDGLDSFKAKLLPDMWEPIYALTNEQQFSPHTLYAIAGAFSGMSPVGFVGRGVVRAVRQEVRWLRERVETRG